MRALIISLSLLFVTFSAAKTVDDKRKKHIPIAMGINLNEPQSQVKYVTHAHIMADLAKSFRPFDESIFERVKNSLYTEGLSAVNFKSEDAPIKHTFIDEFLNSEKNGHYVISRDEKGDEIEAQSFDPKDFLPLDGFKIRMLVNHFAQKRYRKFSEFGITVNHDRSVLLQKGSHVYTSGLESALPGDVPDGIYPLYFDGDVDLKVDGFAKIVDCPEKYETARKCLDIQIPKTPSADGIKLTFTANSDTHLTNFHLILPTVNQQEVLDGKIVFNPDYLKYIEPFSTYRVMNTMMSSPRSPFECVTTFVKARDIYAKPKQKLEDDYLKHSVKIKLLEILKNTEIETLKTDLIDVESIHKTFAEYKNEDNEIFYTEVEIEKIDSLVKTFLADQDFFNILTMDYRIQQSKDALIPLKEKLTVLRKKSLEFNWNYVNPNEDYGNCLMKYARTSTDRAKLNDQFWGSSYITPEEKWRGLPYEAIVELINQTKSNVWVNIPHNASIDYIEEMSEYFVKNLNKNSKIFIELSNEVWNGGFAGQKYFTGLGKYRYEHYVTEFLEQFEQYLKTSRDKVVSYRNLRKGYLVPFKKYKKEILEELEQFKTCKNLENNQTLLDETSLTDGGASLGLITQSTALVDDKPQKFKITNDGLELAKLRKLLFTDNNTDCQTYTENGYNGDNSFIKPIKFKKGNFFEKLALEIPYLNAYWLGYTGAAKGKLKIQVEDKNGKYKDVLVDRFKYTKENKSELHSPDLVYHYSGDEIRQLRKELFLEFEKGWKKRKAHGNNFDFKMNAKIFVLKHLDRAYKVMSQMAYVERLDKVAKIWMDSGINPDNLIVTLATKQNNPNLTKSMLAYAAKKGSIERIDAIATPAYFYACFGDLKYKDTVIKPHKFGPCKGISKGVLNAKTAEEIIDIIKDPENPKGVESVRKEIIAHKKIIKDTGQKLSLIAYEGGHHLALTNMGRDQREFIHSHKDFKEERIALFKEAIEHEAMGEITKQLYKVWLEEGGKQFINFYMPQSFHEWGSFGLSLSLSDRSTPRYRAAQEFASKFKKAESKSTK